MPMASAMMAAVYAARCSVLAHTASNVPSCSRGRHCLQHAGVGERRVGLALPAADRVPLALAVAQREQASDGVWPVGRHSVGG